MFFSIVIPTFNHSKLLQRALKSINSQSNKNFEVIVIDNNSKDDTEKVIRDSPIKNLVYEKINNNGIISKSRNRGIEISKGDWVHFLDSDDTLHSEKINFLTKNLSSSIDISCNAQEIIDEDTSLKKIWNYGPYEENFYKKMLIDGNKFSTTASVIKKDFLIKSNVRFDERKNFVTAEDYDFFLNLVNAGAKIKFFDNVLGAHYKYKGSQSSNYQLHKKSIENVIKHHVFNIQKFSSDKQKLWHGLKWRFILMDLLNNIKEKKYILSVIVLFRLIVKSPLKLVKFFFLKFKKNFNF